MAKLQPPAPSGPDYDFTRWAFNFMMAGLGLAVVLVIAYLIGLY